MQSKNREENGSKIWEQNKKGKSMISYYMLGGSWYIFAISLKTKSAGVF